MCVGAICITCSKKSWRGCGNHIPQVLSGVPEEQWCSCQPKVNINGNKYPPSAAIEVLDPSWRAYFAGTSNERKRRQE
ncbi:hypothetical protein V2G26_010900 [Clonostachys chloroleuca]